VDIANSKTGDLLVHQCLLATPEYHAVQLVINLLTLSDPMSDLVRHYDFPVPDAFLDL
jgi:hypothetical protein